MYLEYTVNKRISHVYQCLTDEKLFVDTHPLIYKIETNSRGKWQIYETVKLLGTERTFNYPAQIFEDDRAFHVSFKAIIHKIVFLSLDFHLAEMGAKTIIREYVNIDCFLPIHLILQKQIREQHKVWFNNIERI